MSRTMSRAPCERGYHQQHRRAAHSGAARGTVADLLRAHNRDLEGALKAAKSDACRLRFECAALREDVDVLVAERDALRRELYGRYGPQLQSQPQSVLVLLASDSED